MQRRLLNDSRHKRSPKTSHWLIAGWNHRWNPVRVCAISVMVHRVAVWPVLNCPGAEEFFECHSLGINREKARAHTHTHAYRKKNHSTASSLDLDFGESSTREFRQSLRVRRLARPGHKRWNSAVPRTKPTASSSPHSSPTGGPLVRNLTDPSRQKKMSHRRPSSSLPPPPPPKKLDAVVGALFLTLMSLASTVHSHKTDFSIHQLMDRHFPHRISDDIYMDPCKAGTLSFLFSSVPNLRTPLFVSQKCANLMRKNINVVWFRSESTRLIIATPLRILNMALVFLRTFIPKICWGGTIPHDRMEKKKVKTPSRQSLVK